MLYPKNIEQKLGFDKIRELLKKNCLSPLGQTLVDKIRFSDNFDAIVKLTQQTHEFTKILLASEEFPTQYYFDTTLLLEKASIEGSFLEEADFQDIRLSLKTILACVKFFTNREEVYPALSELITFVDIDKQILQAIDLIIDERGIVKDNASPDLLKIRRELLSLQSSLRKTLDSVLKNAKSQGFTTDSASFTIRNGRMVIPIQAEYKRKIKGFIQDESATGQTVFIEPEATLELNNEIKEWEYKERREIVKILTNLTTTCRPYIPALKKAYYFLAIMDFIRAKAKFAITLEAPLSIQKKEAILDWRNARHPLLQLSFKEQNKKVVPLTIHLDKTQRILVISGPNAGGKSVTLKTVGLIQYMYQCGLLVPVEEGSIMGIFKDIFIDIGDEQSLENDLSTYSSHLTNMKHFLEFAGAKTLFLIDEFGTGTEPSLGGAIAESILDNLNQQKAFGVVNTHYGNLKIYAQNHEGVVNGAMRFDMAHLEPLYKLEIGQPGSSFAFEIAAKIGLPKNVIEKAKEKLGTKQVDFDRLLKELEHEKREFDTKNQALISKEKEFQKALLETTTLQNILETEKKKILNQAKIEAKTLLKEANQKIEQAIRDIKEQKADKENTKSIRKTLEKLDDSLITDEILEIIEEEIEVIEGEINVGDFVKIKGQTTIGEVLQIRGKDVEIRIGELKSTLKRNRLEKISKKNFKIQQKELPKTTLQGLNINERMSNFSYNLDLRGKRGEEALIELDQWMDNALLLGHQELRIVHGKGDGILRKIIRERLKKYTQVISLTDEHADRGGAGVTIVKLR